MNATPKAEPSFDRIRNNLTQPRDSAELLHQNTGGFGRWDSLDRSPFIDVDITHMSGTAVRAYRHAGMDHETLAGDCPREATAATAKSLHDLMNQISGKDDMLRKVRSA